MKQFECNWSSLKDDKKSRESDSKIEPIYFLMDVTIWRGVS